MCVILPHSASAGRTGTSRQSWKTKSLSSPTKNPRSGLYHHFLIISHFSRSYHLSANSYSNLPWMFIWFTNTQLEEVGLVVPSADEQMLVDVATAIASVTSRKGSAQSTASTYVTSRASEQSVVPEHVTPLSSDRSISPVVSSPKKQNRYLLRQKIQDRVCIITFW